MCRSMWLNSLDDSTFTECHVHNTSYVTKLCIVYAYTMIYVYIVPCLLNTVLNLLMLLYYQHSQ